MIRVLIVCLVSATKVFSQEIAPNANTIIIKGVTFKQVCMSLLDSGFVIDKKDSDFETVSTKPKEFPKLWNAEYLINVRVKDSVAYISGLFSAPPGGGLFYNSPVYNHCKKNGQPHPKSLARYPFMLINSFAKCFGKPLEYMKQ